MIREYIQLIKENIGWWPLLFSFFITARVFGFNIGPVDLIGVALMLIAAISAFRKLNFDHLCLVFVLYLPLSILLAQPNPVFRSWSRYAFFLLLLLAVSPLVKSNMARHFRQKVFAGVCIFSVAISITSFVCYYIGINLMKSSYTGEITTDYITNTAGTFSGICSHSMLLGPISGFATIACCYMAMKRKQIVFWIASIMCMGSVLFSASRSSVIATILGVLVLLYSFSKVRSTAIKRIIVTLFLAAITFPLWDGALAGITAKNQGNIEKGINTDSREDKWNMRIEEWQDSPVWGIGFVAVSDRDVYIAQTGTIEPGSSWLAVLSMTGIIGFILFFCIFFRAARNTIFRYTPEGALFGGALIFVGVHMIAEGHIFSAGSFLCFLVWLIIGCATDYYVPKRIMVF